MKGIGLKIGTQWLDLYPDTRISMRLISPLFSDVLEDNSHTLSFDVPTSPHNEGIFQHQSSATNYAGSSELNATLFFDGLPLYQVLIKRKKSSGESYSINLEIENSRLANKLGEKNMQTYAYDGERLIDTTNLNDPIEMRNHCVATLDETYDYIFYPVRNTGFYDGKHYLEDNTVVADPDEFIHPEYANYYQFETFRDNYTFFSNNAFVDPPFYFNSYFITPYFWLKYVLTHILSHHGFTLIDTEGWLTDVEIQRLTLYNNRALDDAPIQLQMTSFTQWISVYLAWNTWAKTIKPWEHMPDVMFRDFLRELGKMFNLAFLVRDNEVKLIPKKDIIARTDYEDWRSKSLRNYFIEFNDPRDYTFQSDQDSSDDLVSGDTFQEDAQQRSLGNVDTIEELPTDASVEDIYYVISKNAFYQLVYIDSEIASQTAWRLYSYRAHGLNLGTENQTQIRSSISTTQVYNNLWFDFDDPILPNAKLNWRIPHVKQPGTSKMYELGTNEFAPRLLFYRGIVDAEITEGEMIVANWKTYPQASPDDVSGLYNYSLYWHGAKGLYNTWWKPWLDHINGAKTAQMMLDMNIVDLLSLDWTRKKLFAVREGNMVAYVRQLDIQLTNDGLDLVRADLIRI